MDKKQSSKLTLKIKNNIKILLNSFADIRYETNEEIKYKVLETEISNISKLDDVSMVEKTESYPEFKDSLNELKNIEKDISMLDKKDKKDIYETIISSYIHYFGLNAKELNSEKEVSDIVNRFLNMVSGSDGFDLKITNLETIKDFKAYIKSSKRKIIKELNELISLETLIINEENLQDLIGNISSTKQVELLENLSIFMNGINSLETEEELFISNSIKECIEDKTNVVSCIMNNIVESFNRHSISNSISYQDGVLEFNASKNGREDVGFLFKTNNEKGEYIIASSLVSKSAEPGFEAFQYLGHNLRLGNGLENILSDKELINIKEIENGVENQNSSISTEEYKKLSAEEKVIREANDKTYLEITTKKYKEVKDKEYGEIMKDLKSYMNEPKTYISLHKIFKGDNFSEDKKILNVENLKYIRTNVLYYNKGIEIGEISPVKNKDKESIAIIYEQHKNLLSKKELEVLSKFMLLFSNLGWIVENIGITNGSLDKEKYPIIIEMFNTLFENLTIPNNLHQEEKIKVTLATGKVVSTNALLEGKLEISEDSNIFHYDIWNQLNKFLDLIKDIEDKDNVLLSQVKKEVLSQGLTFLDIYLKDDNEYTRNHQEEINSIKNKIKNLNLYKNKESILKSSLIISTISEEKDKISEEKDDKTLERNINKKQKLIDIFEYTEEDNYTYNTILKAVNGYIIHHKIDIEKIGDFNKEIESLEINTDNFNKVKKDIKEANIYLLEVKEGLENILGNNLSIEVQTILMNTIINSIEKDTLNEEEIIEKLSNELNDKTLNMKKGKQRDDLIKELMLFIKNVYGKNINNSVKTILKSTNQKNKNDQSIKSTTTGKQ